MSCGWNAPAGCPRGHWAPPARLPVAPPPATMIDSSHGHAAANRTNSHISDTANSNVFLDDQQYLLVDVDKTILRVLVVTSLVSRHSLYTMSHCVSFSLK